MGECGVSEENIKQIFNSKLNGQEQRMIMSYYTQLRRESKKSGVFVGITLVIICYFVVKVIFEVYNYI